MRDADAALFLEPILGARGYAYAGPIFNYPHPQARSRPPLIDVDDSFLRASDLIVLTTRPPMDDWRDKQRSPVMTSFTTLESKVFAALGRYLTHCSRVEVTIAEALAEKFPRIAERKATWFGEYRTKGDKRTRGARANTEMTRFTLAYMIYEKHAWPGGPALLAAFGMSGPDTLVWAHRLGHDYDDLVARTPFVMAKIVPQPIPERPTSIAFSADWSVQLLTHVRDDAAARRRDVRRTTRNS